MEDEESRQGRGGGRLTGGSHGFLVQGVGSLEGDWAWRGAMKLETGVGGGLIQQLPAREGAGVRACERMRDKERVWGEGLRLGDRSDED